MLKYVRNAVLGLFAFAFGVGLGATDFLYQQHKAGGIYTMDDYTQLQIDRFDGSSGTLGLIFRKSTRVTPHLPAAPEGWNAHVWSSIPDEQMFSRPQREARRRHLVRAVPDLSFMDGLTENQHRLYDVYLDDVSRMYRKADGAGLIDLYVNVPGLEIGSDAWRNYFLKVQAYYDHMDMARFFGTFANVAWTERTGPVERAASLNLPYDLRKFEAQIGSVRLEMKARASDEDIRAFMASMDLSGLRMLAETAPPRPPLPEREIPPFLDNWPRGENGAVVASLEDCSDPRPRISKVVFCY